MPQNYYTIIGHHSYVTPKFLHLYTSRFLVLAIQLYTLLVVLCWVICQNTSPHNVCIFMCRYRKMYYYCTLTAAWTLIFLTISTDVSLFLIISPHESCDIVHLPIWSQFSFSFTPTRLYLYFAITSPLWICFFSSHACMSHATYLIFQPFSFIAKILANLVVFTWSSRCLSIYRTCFHFHCL